MKCPYCFQPDTYVTDSRNIEEGGVVRRRRICHQCNGKFTTHERIQSRNLVVIKKSGFKRAFDREKIVRSITVALSKQSTSEEKINEMVNNIIASLRSNNMCEVTTKKIADLVMEELIKFDFTAYIRFVSAYKDFTTAKDFIDFINQFQLQNS